MIGCSVLFIYLYVHFTFVAVLFIYVYVYFTFILFVAVKWTEVYDRLSLNTRSAVKNNDDNNNNKVKLQ